MNCKKGSHVMNPLAYSICSDFAPRDMSNDLNVLGSMPIITCSGKRSGKGAREIADKWYYTTKGMNC